VQLAHGLRPVAEETLEELYGGSDDHRRVPILGRQTAPFGGGIELFAVLSFVGRCAVMLQHDRRAGRLGFEDVAVHLRRLLGDADVGDGHDHALQAVLQAVLQGVFEREAHDRASLAAPDRHAQAEQPE
jgi:hypothetical protein